MGKQRCNRKTLSQGKAESINQLISCHQHFLTVCTGQTLETKCCWIITHLILTFTFQVRHLFRACIIEMNVLFCFSYLYDPIFSMLSTHCSNQSFCAFRPPLPLHHYSLHFHFVCNFQQHIFRLFQLVDGVHYNVSIQVIPFELV